MARFKGQAENSVDEKGRLAIPAKMRRVLTPEANNTFTATLGFDQCIALYPNDRWEQMEDEFDRLNQFNSETRLFIRDTLRWAEEVSLDKQGRIVLPKELMLEADLGDTALVIGALDHIEVWDPARYEDYLDDRSTSKEEIAEMVMGNLNGRLSGTEGAA